MKKLLIAAACMSMICGTAVAQTGSPKGDTNVPNPSASPSSNDMSKSGMNSGAGGTMSNDSMKSGTSGMSGGSMSKEGRKSDHMKKDEMKK